MFCTITGFRFFAFAFSALLLALAALPFTAPAAKLPDAALVKDHTGAPAVNISGKIIPLPAGAMQRVWDSGLRFISVREGGPLDALLPQGRYIFGEDGTVRAYLDCGDVAPDTDVMSLSPNGTHIAVDFGMSSYRQWRFYAYPSMQPLKGASLAYTYHLPVSPHTRLSWLNDDTVLTTSLAPTTRQCKGDPCGQSSVMLHSLKTNETVPLLQATALCDYSLVTVVKYADGTLSEIAVESQCQPNIKAWESTSPGLTEKFSVELPEGWPR